MTASHNLGAGAPRPVLVTGLPRSGTSFVGKMLAAGRQLVYVNEPMNPRHPPGRSPGKLAADVESYFQYVCPENEDRWLEPFRATAGLRYRLGEELRRNHGVVDVARAARDVAAFTYGRWRGRRALLDDPYAVMSVAWFTDRLDADVLVLVRDPVAVVGSWRALRWTVDPAELLSQPLLVRDHLEPFRDDMERLAGSDDWLETTCLLWRTTYRTVHRAARDRPCVLIRRYEDLARDPLAGFADLYRRLDLTWSPAVHAAVRTGTTPVQASKRPFVWTLRGGLRRTAYQPMDSRSTLDTYRRRLSPEEVDRVLHLTEDVRSLYYDQLDA